MHIISVFFLRLPCMETKDYIVKREWFYEKFGVNRLLIINKASDCKKVEEFLRINQVYVT